MALLIFAFDCEYHFPSAWPSGTIASSKATMMFMVLPP